jgi:serine/threonine protein kinase/tetratricopeptide (TPR) repeat protein
MLGKRLGQYLLVEKIGQGGMGEVYRARDEQLDRDVAVKLISAERFADREARESFRQEALALSRLNHPHIATIHQFGQEEDVDFLVMEYIEGQTLLERIQASPIGERELRRLACDVAAGLAEAHEQGLVHRDLKPGNVKLNRQSRPKILDFGLARPYERADETSKTLAMPGNGEIAGTLAYMAPELLRGEEATPASDIWAFGIILHQAISQQLPFAGNTNLEVSAAILHGERSEIPDGVSGALSGVIERCLDPEPSLRYQNGRELLNALEAIQSTFVAADAGASTTSRRVRWPLLAVLGTAIAAVVVLAITLGPGGDEALPLSARDVGALVALPSTVIGPEADQYLSDAVPRNLSAQLSGAPELITKLPVSTAEYETFDMDMGRVASEYDVNVLLISSVTAEAQGLALTLQLVAAPSRQILWSGEFSGSKQRYLDLIRVAGRGLLDALRPASTAAEPSTLNSEAELALQQGHYHLNFYLSRRLDDDFVAARESFEQALALDARFCDAAAGLSQLELVELTRGKDPLAALAQAKDFAEQALELNPECSAGWQQLAFLEDMSPVGNLDKSLEYGLKALAYDPTASYAYGVIGNSAMRATVSLSVDAYEMATNYNPMLLTAGAARAGLLALQHDYPRASVELDRLLRVQPDLPQAVLNQCGMFLYQGDVASAQASYEKLETLHESGRLPPGMIEFIRDVVEFGTAIAQGTQDEATGARDRLAARSRGEYPGLYWKRNTLVALVLFAQAGVSDDFLIEILRRRADLGVIDPYDILLEHPVFARLRANPDSQPLLDNSRRHLEGMLELFDDARERNELPASLEQSVSAVRTRVGL